MKTLILDIETSPIMGKVWSLWKQNVSLDQIEDDWFIMAYAAKWLDEDEMYYNDIRETIDDELPDVALLEELWYLLDEADFVIAHNGDRFDLKKINARLILNNFDPPSTYKSIDTLKIAKKHFGFTSNKLAYLTANLCEHKKMSHGKFPGFKLWNECMIGNIKAWDEMEAYNRMDVLSLEELYLKLRPWYSSHPNVNVDKEDQEVEACPKCGSVHLQKRGFYYTNKGKYQRFHCNDCGGWSASTYSENTVSDRKQLLAPR